MKGQESHLQWTQRDLTCDSAGWSGETASRCAHKVAISSVLLASSTLQVADVGLRKDIARLPPYYVGSHGNVGASTAWFTVLREFGVLHFEKWSRSVRP